MRNPWVEQEENEVKDSVKLTDAIQIFNAAKQETDPVRMVRLENWANASCRGLNRAERRLLLKELGEIGVLAALEKTNGEIEKWTFS